MHPEKLRASLQLGFMFLLMLVLFTAGLGCICFAPPPAGNDSSSPELASMKTVDVMAGPGEVTRYGSMSQATLVASQGEAENVSQGMPDFFFGMLLPTAPGANQPGSLLGAPTASYAMSGTLQPLELKEDASKVRILNTLYPPPDGSQWAALTLSDTHALDDVLSKPIDTQNFALTYVMTFDFHGADACNGCELKMTGCAPGSANALFPADSKTASSQVMCTPPVSSYITLVDNTGKPLPGAPTVAAFSLIGGIQAASSLGGQVAMPLALQQTSQTTLTFDLKPIQSALGWNYAWQDMQGNPITQIEVPTFNAWWGQSPNLKVVGDNVPTCSQMIDVITLDATEFVPSSRAALVTAHTTANINVVPDPANCTVIDVAVRQAQETSVILSGNRMTYTLTISNLMDSAVDGVIQQTVTPTAAVSSAVLPAECSIVGNVVTCNVTGIPAHGATSITLSILGVPGYKGQLVSNVLANPAAGAADDNFGDNISGPLVATVNFTRPTGLPDGEEPVYANLLFMPGLNR